MEKAMASTSLAEVANRTLEKGVIQYLTSVLKKRHFFLILGRSWDLAVV
jgi:hypothetical protein